jgi:hypothetical protein
MSGFDAAEIAAARFRNDRYRTNFVLNIGYSDRATLRRVLVFFVVVI